MPGETEPKTYTLELGDDKVYLALGKKGVIVRVETEPKLGRDIGVVEFDTTDLVVTRNGSKVINAPTYTWPGQKITVKKEGQPERIQIKHLPEEKKTT